MSVVDTSRCARRGDYKSAGHYLIFFWQKWGKKGEHLNRKCK